LLYTKNERYQATGKKPQEHIQRYLSEWIHDHCMCPSVNTNNRTEIFSFL
jgi:hypothetical protein